MLGERRRAVTMDVVGVKRKKAVDRSIDFAAQAVLDALAYHGALLARYCQKVRLAVGRDRSAKRHVQLLARPPRAPRLAVSQLQMIDAEGLREVARRLNQGARGVGVAGRRAAVDAERQRNKRVTEEPALDFRQRQDADDLPATFGDAVVGTMAKDVLDDLAPADTMKEARLSARLDIRFPTQRIPVIECAHGSTLCSGLPGCQFRRRGIPHAA